MSNIVELARRGTGQTVYVDLGYGPVMKGQITFRQPIANGHVYSVYIRPGVSLRRLHFLNIVRKP